MEGLIPHLGRDERRERFDGSVLDGNGTALVLSDDPRNLNSQSQRTTPNSPLSPKIDSCSGCVLQPRCDLRSATNLRRGRPHQPPSAPPKRRPIIRRRRSHSTASPLETPIQQASKSMRLGGLVLTGQIRGGHRSRRRCPHPPSSAGPASSSPNSPSQPSTSSSTATIALPQFARKRSKFSRFSRAGPSTVFLY